MLNQSAKRADNAEKENVIMGMDQYLYKIEKINKALADVYRGKNTIKMRDDIKDISLFDESDVLWNGLKPIEKYLQKIPMKETVFDQSKYAKGHGIPENYLIRETVWTPQYVVLYFYKIDDNGQDIPFSGTGGWEHEIDDKDALLPLPKNKPGYFLITKEELDEKYWHDIDVDKYAVKMKEVMYWRKNYDLSEAMQRACAHEILNEGYYPVTKKMAVVLSRHGCNITELDIPDKDEGTIAYHEWY